MARIRSIKIGFYKNEVLCGLSPFHRLLFAGLWLMADKDGRLEDRPQRLKAELFPYDDVNVDDLLNGLSTVSPPFIHRYRTVDSPSCRYIQVITWHKHQRPHHTEPVSVIPPHGELTVVSPLSHGEDPLGEGNGEGILSLGNGDGEGVTPAPLSLVPLRGEQNPHGKDNNLVNGVDLRRHGVHAWCDFSRGLCVPFGLHTEFKAKGLKSDGEMRAWYAETVASFDGRPIGDDVYPFWKNSFAAWIGTVSIQPASRKLTRNEESIAASRRVLARMEGGKL